MIALEVSLHGMANGKHENFSIATNKYLLAVPDGKGPLKSSVRHSNGGVALISLP